MKKVKIINLTPHPITLLGEDKKLVWGWDKPKPGIKLPRLVEEVEKKEPLTIEIQIFRGDNKLPLEIPLRNKTFKECENLPTFQEGIFYIVSGLIASTLKRKDLLVPDTIRNEKGETIGCDSFSQIM